MSEIIIRPAAVRDFPAIHEIQIQGNILTQNQPIDIADLDMQVRGENGIVGVAEVAGETVGFIYGEKLVGRWALAGYYAVRPDFRGTDAFRKLGEWFISECKKRGVKYIVQYADADNEKLVNFYKHFGFEAGGKYIEMIKEI